jgi:hypothetical protein
MRPTASRKEAPKGGGEMTLEALFRRLSDLRLVLAREGYGVAIVGDAEIPDDVVAGVREHKRALWPVLPQHDSMTTGQPTYSAWNSRAVVMPTPRLSCPSDLPPDWQDMLEERIAYLADYGGVAEEKARRYTREQVLEAMARPPQPCRCRFCRDQSE